MAVLNVGLLQMRVAKGDPRTNLDTLVGHLPRAAADGVGLLLLPEMWTTGFPYRDLSRLAGGTPEILQELSRLASRHHLAIAGTMPELDRGKLYNTFYVVDREGSLAAAYRKIHLFPGFHENSFLDPGDAPQTATIEGMTLGLITCFDLRFPELSRKLALKGASLLLVSAQWPAERRDHWQVLTRARAVENQVFVAAVNTCGRTGRTHFAGDSVILDPAGAVLAEAGGEEALVKAALDGERVAEVRREVDYLACRVRDADEFLTSC